MAQKTLIGLQKSTGDKIISVPTNDRSGQLNITGKVLNSLYNNITSITQLIEAGTNPNGNGNIDVSNIVNRDNYLWGCGGVSHAIDKTYDNSSKYLKELNNPWHTHIYLFSETDNKWYVASSDSKEFKPLTEELAKL